MKVYIVEGGIGKHVIFSSLIPKLAKDEQITIMSSYPDIYENTPYVHRSLSRVSPYQWEDLIMRQDTELFFYEPYYDLDYIKGIKHIIHAWCDGYNIEYDNNMFPELYINQQLKNEVMNFKNQNGKYIIVQLSGSQSPYFGDKSQKFINNGAVKDYPIQYAQELINIIKEKYNNLNIINYSFQNEGIQLENTITLNTSYLMYAALLEQAETFIGIDSSLVHFAGALRKEGIVLWGATNPNTLGYPFHTHLTGECKLNNLHCNKPYVRELGDYIGSGQRWSCPDSKCIDIKPERIVSELSKILDKEKNNEI